MIVPMKKAVFIMQSKDKDTSLDKLAQLGALHIKHIQPPQGKGLSLLNEDKNIIDAALTILSQQAQCSQQVDRELGDWRHFCRHIVDQDKRINQLEEYLYHLKQDISALEPWGDFDPESVKELASNGVTLDLYKIPENKFDDFAKIIAAKKINTIKGVIYCITLSTEDIDIPFKKIPLPKISLKAMQKRLAEDKKVIELLRAEIKNSACLYNSLIKIRDFLMKQIEFEEAASGMGGVQELAYIKGFIPFDSEDRIIKASRQNNWGFFIADPDSDEEVPTLLRNPRWVSFINPVFKLIEIIPGYRELDVSLIFLIFFSIFFGILIGDAGYGLVYMLITFLIQKKTKTKLADKNNFFLFYILSSCAIIWGLLTATFFGQEWCLKVGMRPLAPALNNPKSMQTVCFFIGALHLSIAHSWRAVLRFPSLNALVEIGWIGVLWSAFFFARMLILGESLPGFVIYLLYSSIALVVLFTNPQRNILKGISEGLGTLALSLMNNFTDVVSYVRLFAVGMATLAIAETGNSMARGLSSNPVVAAIAVPLILVVGHGLNIILGPISVLVHGVRLNVLEFSGHAGVSWSGVAYRPFKKDKTALNKE